MKLLGAIVFFVGLAFMGGVLVDHEIITEEAYNDLAVPALVTTVGLYGMSLNDDD